ncbi:MAG TPA: SCO family protein [Opitutus sp.]|nr:SCO family protein [Opitutus sp.]
MRCVLIVVCLALCLVPAQAAERTFTVKGTVTAPLADGTITVAHEPIPDYMPAMTMPFNVAPEAMAAAARLRAGDQVEFRWRVTKDSSHAWDFKRIGRDETHAPPPAGPPVAARRVREGDTIPSFALTDQEGNALTEAALRGKATLLTFIFTRCPVPEFCPRMSERFQSLQRQLTAGQIHAVVPVQLLSVTIDPEFDTPAVLREYGRRYGADPNTWHFATGSPAEIESLRRSFAVFAEKSAAILDHTLATVLIGPDLRVAAIWRGNRWKEEDVAASLARLDSANGRATASE